MTLFFCPPIDTNAGRTRVGDATHRDGSHPGCCLLCQCDRCLNGHSPAPSASPVAVGTRGLKRRAVQLRNKAKRTASRALELYRQAYAIDGNDRLMRNWKNRNDLERVMRMKDAELDALEKRSA